MTAPGPQSDALPAGLEPGPAPPPLREYLRVLSRRKWLLISTLLLVPTIALAITAGQQPLYQGSAEVLLGRLDLASGLTGIPDTTAGQPQRVAQTQAGLARVPAVAERTLRAVGLRDRTVDDFLKASSVTTHADSDLLTFTVTDPDSRLASRLASAYARQYRAYRLGLDTAAIQKARLDLETRIKALQASGGAKGSLYQSLVADNEKLRTMEALLSSNAAVVRADETAVKVRPRPGRTAMLSIALGAVLAIGVAFLAEAIDTRVRHVDEIGRRLGLPLLARLPERKRRRLPTLPTDTRARIVGGVGQRLGLRLLARPSERRPRPSTSRRRRPSPSAGRARSAHVHGIGRRLGLPPLTPPPALKRRGRPSAPLHQVETPAAAVRPLMMLDNPTSLYAEGYRVLRANLDFVNTSQRAQTIMLTSALESEGKSETAANLAIAFARSGRRVALVDLDLRRSSLHRLFELADDRGVADVAAGVAALDDVLVQVPVARRRRERTRAGPSNQPDGGMLELLPAGSVLLDADEFAGTQALGEILGSLRKRADLVLVDTPALLPVGDAIALSAKVDAMLVVVRFTTIRRPILKELGRVLDACAAPKLGYVLTFAGNELGYRYGYGYGEAEPREHKDRMRMRVARHIRVAAER